MAAPALVTVLFDALTEAHAAKPAMLSRDLARLLEDKVLVIDPDELHKIEMKLDGWTVLHPMACRPRLFGCPFTQAAHALGAPTAEEVGVYTIVLEEDQIKMVEKLS